MKYMGSKRAMLSNGLGNLLQEEVATAERFVDLFTGSGAVASHVAQRYPVEVLAVDLQAYSAILAKAIIGRVGKINAPLLWSNWHKRATAWMQEHHPPKASRITKSFVIEARAWCAEKERLPITQAYGGHYYSPEQALWIDAFRGSLPIQEPAHTVALAALIQVASKCATAPGHTAQPLQPKRSSLPFFNDIWSWSITQLLKNTFEAISVQYALKVGETQVANANTVAKNLREGDLAFIDPPYSAVHYSRYYHVLETIAHGKPVDVSGKGRYPDTAHRPSSDYSILTKATDALDDLLCSLSAQGVRAIVTFPDDGRSNGLSGPAVIEIASQYFHVWQEVTVDSCFSTLGGTSSGTTLVAGRDARHKREELVVVLKPR